MYKLASLLASSFFLFTLWVIYIANTGGSSIFFRISNSIPYGDKLGHFILFGCFTLLLNFAFKFKKTIFYSSNIMLGTLCVIVFALGEEITQAFIPRREFDFIDLGSDALGIALFNYLSLRASEGFRFYKFAIKRR